MLMEEPSRSNIDFNEVTLHSWWRRGGVEPPVQKMSRLDLLQAYPALCSCPWAFRRRNASGPAELSLVALLGVGATAPRIYGAQPLTSRVRRNGRSCLVRQLRRVVCRQLLFCHQFYEVSGTSTCNPPEGVPCRNHASPGSLPLSHRGSTKARV